VAKIILEQRRLPQYFFLCIASCSAVKKYTTSLQFCIFFVVPEQNFPRQYLSRHFLSEEVSRSLIRLDFSLTQRHISQAGLSFIKKKNSGIHLNQDQKSLWISN
jgi:hypothetical protein